ncbi:PAAR domain-containing protein [Acinetobacter seifertii]|uniref:PAAR domain-containing protein n=1 Tax=Acinetobacter seifertii TaxID=1530123 RepID=UPI00168B5805|nr:PAAR domain-containing protein [Acinetobacter seifertii]QNX87875.1 PAAR domain-containing protein [Acinetobacter seifertii]
MTSPIFLQDLPIEQLEKLSENDIQQIFNAEQLYWNNKPHTTYHVAVHGAKSQNGGLVNASSNSSKIKGLSIARIGDAVIYADGTTSKIISGAGTACIVDGSPVALVGSRLENGDEIIDSPNTSIAIRIYKDQPLPENFLSHD